MADEAKGDGPVRRCRAHSDSGPVVRGVRKESYRKPLDYNHNCMENTTGVRRLKFMQNQT